MSAIVNASPLGLSVSPPKAVSANNLFQRGVLMASVGCAALSLTLPFKVSGALGLRTLAFVSSATSCKGHWSQDSLTTRLIKCAKLAAVTLGVVAVVVARPLLMVASLVADIGIQAIGAGRALLQRDWEKSLVNGGMLGVDVLVVSGLLTGSWALMATASAVSALVLAGAAIRTAIYAKNRDDIFEVWCLASLSVISIMGALKAAEIYKTVPKTSHYSITNTHDHEIIFKDNYGNIVARAQPGETVEFNVPCKDLSPIYTQVPSNDGKYPDRSVIAGYHISGEMVDNSGHVIEKINFLSKYSDVEKYVIKASLAEEDFPYLPVGGTAIVTKEIA